MTDSKYWPFCTFVGGKAMKAAQSVIAILLLLLVLAGCGAKTDVVQPQEQPDAKDPPGEIFPGQPGETEKTGKESRPAPSVQPAGEETLSAQLFTLVETEEEALEIAELYGIKLIKVSNGVATFHTDEDPDEVIRRGEENGWPLIEINGTMQMH